MSGLKILRLSLLVPALLLLLYACSSTDGEEEQGPAPLIDFEEEKRFYQLWSSSIGDGQGGIFNRIKPAVDKGVIYVASADGNVEAITLAEGDSLWDVELEQGLIGGVGVGADVIMLGSASGEVVVLDRQTGEARWTVDVGGEVLSAPQTNGQLIFVQTFDGQLLALDINDGARVWSYRNTVPILSLRGTSTALVVRDAVLAGFANGRVISFDVETGAIRWNTRLAMAKGDSEIERIIDIDGELLEGKGVVDAVS